MPNTYPIKLTQLESLYLSDALSMFSQGPPDALPGQSSPYPTLLLKVCGAVLAVLEGEQQNASATVYLSLPELWMVREVTKSSVVIGSERVGLSLLMKVYAGIRALAAETDMQSLVSDLGEVADDEPGKSEYAAQLERLKNGNDIESGGTSSNERDHENPGDDKPRDSNENNPNDHAAPAA